jgi:eukaryotic translation initiation factor 2-alpha kinase 4
MIITLFFSIPKLLLENPKGLKDADVARLNTQLSKEIYSLKGEVMIFELCQLVQIFLHEHNQPPKEVNESFYDTMLKNKQIQDQKKQDELNEKERKLQEQFQNDILKRKEQLMRESRIRRTTQSESSPRHLSSSNSEDAKYLQEVCDEHRGSETLYMPAAGRKIQQGACLGHSQKGCINFCGIDLSSGKLVYITEWSIKVSQIESHNLTADSFIDMVEKKVADLSKLRHKHIIGYECVCCIKKKDQVQVFLVQEFLLGISIISISGGLGWSSEGASIVAKGVLEALIFLHNNGVSHGNLLDSTVFMDSAGIIKVTDFSVVPFLQELVTGEQLSADLPSLGTLIESLMPTPHLEMRDFINRCKSERTLSGSDLLDHPFLYSMLLGPNLNSPDEHKAVQNFIPPADRPLSTINVTPPFIAPLISSDHSRLQTEFETINFIGKGAYGDVLKVRNILDNRQYAIKRIPLSAKNKQLYKKMTREVELLSRLNHENVVRYFNSWIETQTAPIENSENDESDWSMSHKLTKAMVKTHSQHHLGVQSADDSSDDDSFSPGWNNFIGNPGNNDDSDSSDGIEFVDSKGQVVKCDEESSEDEKNERRTNDGVVMRKNVILYIQMEFCEKSTLRTAIDGNLYQDKERLWKLFREIVEGLSHIHQVTF